MNFGGCDIIFMMERYFTKTFFRFFMGFVAIIALAFGVMYIAGSQLFQGPIDNVAAPR
ncbi:MAG: hypothetical protein UY84_C0001G0214 [Candidatus Adlerbacteria bacterium GW2011_GWA2_54_12]|uniref:Uncharacterized protein n=2 Tax=Candidatus Adleribacteriota TaxID=1752736 RepID=A0A0G1XXS3_9BACT|nr:MAG: hypothetical protein UY83_C0003G0076 [Candidatus Adlerbacteria bacterium GW2011_GWA1_54_10]KKW36326.1 MAG: hypothetical protein UY84_C0001G0214 [Candidatus Adlerbacteria bacterium GW2011_GWA2_54_12]KKW37857.1 MAG: hypothetical protein UY86_C0003G0079 [Candidatus Adlerbacteria bacterium GW2011_GWB1_54_7]